MKKLKTGIELIAKERATHPSKGYDKQHDALHANGEISLAAACYAVHPMEIFVKDEYHNMVQYSKLLPFDYEISKKKKQLTKLIIAGALIAAEIDRLQLLNK